MDCGNTPASLRDRTELHSDYIAHRIAQASCDAVLFPLMAYASANNNLLRPKSEGCPFVIDLFAGAGGLSLGFEACGFEVVGFDSDSDCCNTYARNLNGICLKVKLDKSTDFPPASIVIASPPCQPFSEAGRRLGATDYRDGFPIVVSAIQRIKPAIFLVENVSGLAHNNKRYLNRIIREFRSLGYRVNYRLLNSVNYSVPQNRLRLILVGHHGGFRFPRGRKKIITSGEALGRMARIAPKESRFLTPSMDKYVAKYELACGLRTPRDLHLDRPARTLTTRNLMGATGDMHRIRLSDGRRRRLRVREAARLQSFPDWFKFSGSESSQLQQIGNAVPPRFAFELAISVRKYINRINESTIDN